MKLSKIQDMTFSKKKKLEKGLFSIICLLCREGGFAPKVLSLRAFLAGLQYYHLFCQRVLPFEAG
jgi:hypothetical protein